MAKFLDKTGLDTFWAKIKSTFQTLGNLVTSWGSTPSDSKYPSEKLVKTSLDAISTNARTIPQDSSKGANLVVNGSGRMSSNYNFSGFTYLPTICYNGSAGSFGFNGAQGNNEFISCDFNKKIIFSADIRNLVVQPSNCVHRIYIAEYDIDKNSITAKNVMYGVGTLTELTQDLNPGDTVVHLADLSNANWLSSTTFHRGFIFWNYQNSYGYLYPPETYSRNVYPSVDSYSLWDVANVNVSTGTITLNSGWTGPAIPAGTKVSRRGSGGSYPYPATITTGDTEWHTLKGYAKGIVAPGTSERVSTKFSQGTAFIKVGMYPSNLSNTDTVTGKRAVVTNFFVYEEQDINDGFGTLPVNRGGTGATTAKNAANILLPSLDPGDDNVIDSDLIIASNHTSGVTDTTKFVRQTAAKLWNYIKGKISSVLGLSESNGVKTFTGNAATATALSAGDDRTKLDGIAEGAEVNVQSDWNQTTSTADDYIKNKPMCGNIVVPNAKWLKLSIPRGTQALHASFMMQTSHGATQMLGVLCMNNYISGDTETITGVSICMLRGGKNAGQNIDGVYEEDNGNGYKNFYLYFGDDNAQHNVYWTWAGGTNNISISVVDSAPSTALSMGHSYLPVIAKNIADSSISVGSDTQGVYVSNNGRIEACKKLVQAVNSIDTSNMDPDVLYVM